VPTCLVITSSESASSIDTQFNALCEELKQADMIPIILDDKKCGNLKQTIKFLRSSLGDDKDKKGGSPKGKKEESGDEMHLVVYAEESSDSLDSDLEVVRRNEDVEMDDGGSSNFISSLVEPSY